MLKHKKNDKILRIYFDFHYKKKKIKKRIEQVDHFEWLEISFNKCSILIENFDQIRGNFEDKIKKLKYCPSTMKFNDGMIVKI